MSEIITGAVNGVPTTATVDTAGVSPVTIPYFPGGATTTLDVDTDGSGLQATNHRVALIGGNLSGRDHFPYAVSDLAGGATTGTGTRYPFTVAADTACLWFYRVKKWHFELTFDYIAKRPDEENPDGVEHTGAGTVEFDFIPLVNPNYPTEADYIEPTTESDLILPRGSFEIAVELDFNGVVTVPLSTGSESPFSCSNITGSASYDDESGEALIAAEWQWNFSDFQWRSGIYSPFSFACDSISATTQSVIDIGVGATYGVNGSASLGGIGEADIYQTHSAPTGSFWETFSNIQVRILPIEFWPYATTSGDPVYNTSTGAQLADPLS